MESKICNAFPVMKDRPLCLHSVKFEQPFIFFVRRVLIQAHRPTQIILIYLDGDLKIVWRICVDRKYAQTMAVATYIAKEVLTCSPIGSNLFSYFILKPPCPVNPSDKFLKGHISYPCSSLLVTKKIKSLLGDFQRVLKSACVDFRSLHPVHPKFSWFPALVVWFISKMFLIWSPCVGAMFFYCYGFRRDQYGLDASFGWIISLCGWSPWVDRVYGYERPSVVAKLLWHIPPPSFSFTVLWTWSRMDSTPRSTISWPASCLHLRLRSWLPSSLCICHASVLCAKQMRMRCVCGGVCARLRSRAVGLDSKRAPWARTLCF
jgi:hypothetical protein